VPQAEAAPEAGPQVPQCGGSLTRAYVRGPLLGGGEAALVLVQLIRQGVNHRFSIRWTFSRAALRLVHSDDERNPRDGHCRIGCENLGMGIKGKSGRSGGSAGSILSIGSSGSILSIGSSGSILSIGSAGSVLSVGSVASFACICSVGSFASAGSILSALSRLSILAWRSAGRETP
jgi:hypothetical protein